MAVVATAGHVDHGKSTLVRLLTGQEPDRWAEERRRGLTIDLGYAWTDIDGRRVSLVDVPGHEHFTGNMLAGLGPGRGGDVRGRGRRRLVGAVAGARPRRGRAGHRARAARRDPVRPGRRRRRPAREALRAAGSAGHPGRRDACWSRARRARACPSCARRWAGSPPVDRGDASTRRSGEPSAPPVRLWVDRSFTIRGAGTVVTGTLPSGRIAVGDEPAAAGSPVRVRGLQSCGEEVRRRSTDRPGWPSTCGASRSAEVGRGDGAAGPAVAGRAAAWSTSPCDAVPGRLTRSRCATAAPARADAARRHRRRAVRTQGSPTAWSACGWPRRSPWCSGDRAVLRDPGRHEVLAGVEVAGGGPTHPPRRAAQPRRQPAAPGGRQPPGRATCRTRTACASWSAWLGDAPAAGAVARAAGRLGAHAARPRGGGATAARSCGSVGWCCAGDAVARAEAVGARAAPPFSVGDGGSGPGHVTPGRGPAARAARLRAGDPTPARRDAARCAAVRP